MFKTKNSKAIERLESTLGTHSGMLDRIRGEQATATAKLMGEICKEGNARIELRAANHAAAELLRRYDERLQVTESKLLTLQQRVVTGEQDTAAGLALLNRRISDEAQQRVAAVKSASKPKKKG